MAENVNLTFWNFQTYLDGRQLDFIAPLEEKEHRISSVIKNPVWGWLLAYPGKVAEVRP